jgi:hypothetical protein
MYGEIPVIFGPAPESIAEQFKEKLEVIPRQLTLDISGSTAQLAVSSAGPLIESIIDLMSFEMAAPFVVGQVNFTDITPPLAVGDEREFGLYAAPPFSLFERSEEMQALQGSVYGELPESIEVEDSKVAAALRWSVKALGTDVRHDQFIFLWIALEILADLSDVRVEGPYVGPCQHEINNCPECNRETSRLIRGATMRAFLGSYGVGEAETKKLWAMRQLMHGAIPFDSEKLKELAGLVQILRAAVTTALKERLAISPEEPPLAAPAGLSVHPAMMLGGTGPATEEEVRSLLPSA